MKDPIYCGIIPDLAQGNASLLSPRREDLISSDGYKVEAEREVMPSQEKGINTNTTFGRRTRVITKAKCFQGKATRLTT